MRKLLCLLLVLSALLSCKKEQTHQQPEVLTQFKVEKTCWSSLNADTLQYVDSALIFINESDTGQSISYKWDFGDFTSNNSINAMHAYSSPGKYLVKLYTFKNSVLKDSFSQAVHIVVGQKEFSGGFTSAGAVDLAEWQNKGTLLLVRKQYSSPAEYSLVAVDSLLHQIWVKSFSGVNSRLTAIQRINANEYLLTGNFMNSDAQRFTLTKITGAGTVLWEKSIANLDAINEFTLVTSDGGFLSVGRTYAMSYVVLVKYDADGNEVWRKQFDGLNGNAAMRLPDNVIEVADGYVFSAQSMSGTGIYITKLNASGTQIAQASTATGNTGTIFGTTTAYANGKYMVSANNTQFVFTFGSTLNFIARKQVSDGNQSCIAAGGFFYLAEGTFISGSLIKLTSDGNDIWQNSIDHTIVLGCTSLYSNVSRYCRKVLATSSGDILAFSDGDNSTSNSTFSVYLVRYSPSGELK
jgi:PKD repeat protein